MKKVLFSLVAVLLLSLSGIAQTTYTMVNSASQLEAGAQYILVGYDNDGQAFVMSYQKSNNRHALTIGDGPTTIVIECRLRAEVVAAAGGAKVTVVERIIDSPSTWSTVEGELVRRILLAGVGGHGGRDDTTILVDDDGVTVVRLLVAHDKGLTVVVVSHQDILGTGFKL